MSWRDIHVLHYDEDKNPLLLDGIRPLFARPAGRVPASGSYVSDGVEYLRRPYPAGGDMGELEIYPVVRLASGLPPGMYHYDAHEHRLRLVRGPDPQVGRLLRVATRTAFQQPDPPQVLLLIAARFGRLMWGYEEMPYSLILKHVGVVYQTMYLVAASMGLAACALGGGDAGAFAAATGLDPAVESSVGEFLLGTPAAG